MRLPPRLGDLTGRVILPVLGSLLMWALAALAIGLADAVRLLAALTFIRSVQLLTRMPTLPALRRRGQAPQKVLRKSRRRASKIQIRSLAAGLVCLSLLVGFLAAAGQLHLAAFTAIMAVGYPVRNLLQTQAQCNVRLFLISGTWAGAALIALSLPLNPASIEIAFLLGAREWIAAAISLIWVHRGPVSKAENLEVLSAAEIKALTASRARRAFGYLIAKAVVGVVIPGAGLLARTGRSFGLHNRLERFVPRHRPSFILFTVGPAIAAAALVLWVPEPSLILVAALLTKVAAAAGGVLIWSPHLEIARTDISGDEEE